MRILPQFLRRLPYVFYAVAAVLFVWELANQWFGLSLTYQYADFSGDAMSSLSKSIALKAAFADAVYMVANGAFLHVAIAIYDKVKGE
jgi:hypothetical protein